MLNRNKSLALQMNNDNNEKKISKVSSIDVPLQKSRLFFKMMDKFLNNHGLVVFKLLNDLLAILMIFFLLLVIADGILPGIISNYFDPAIIVILISYNILLIFFFEKKLHINAKQEGNKKTALALIFIITLLILNAFLHLNIWLNLFLTLASLSVGCFVYKLFSEE